MPVVGLCLVLGTRSGPSRAAGWVGNQSHRQTPIDAVISYQHPALRVQGIRIIGYVGFRILFGIVIMLLARSPLFEYLDPENYVKAPLF